MPDDDLAKAATRQSLTATTFVEIVDTLVGDFDVIEVLTGLTSRCIELLDTAAAGILLADSEGRLRVMSASTEEIQLLELFQIQNDQGPCLDCYRSGAVVSHADLSAFSPWPEFATESVRVGYPSVCAIPLRLQSVILGCLNLFMAEPDELSDGAVVLAQALADVASIAIIQNQANRDAALRERHLQHALTSRIAIEQAKGMIAERGQTDMDEAFARLRAYARNNNRRLTDVAEALVTGQLAVDVVASRRIAPRPGRPDQPTSSGSSPSMKIAGTGRP